MLPSRSIFRFHAWNFYEVLQCAVLPKLAVFCGFGANSKLRLWFLVPIIQRCLSLTAVNRQTCDCIFRAAMRRSFRNCKKLLPNHGFAEKQAAKVWCYVSAKNGIFPLSATVSILLKDIGTNKATKTLWTNGIYYLLFFCEQDVVVTKLKYDGWVKFMANFTLKENHYSYKLHMRKST